LGQECSVAAEMTSVLAQKFPAPMFRELGSKALKSLGFVPNNSKSGA